MASRNPLRRLTWTAAALRLEWEAGEPTEFASLWLRDNCAADRDPGSGQRLVDVADLPGAPRIRRAFEAGGSVTIEWEAEPRSAVFSLDWLADRRPAAEHPRPEHRLRRWLDGAALDARTGFCWAALAALEHDPVARLDWLTRLAQDGIAFIGAVPCEHGAILRAAGLIGFVLETNYGRLFNVRSVAQPENLAYSDHGLGLHTDNPYREPVPGFQALHVLVASPEGGDTLLADGFAIAEHLRATDPDAFAILTQTPVPFHYRSADADLYAERPLIRLAADGAVRAVHYNNRSVAPLPLAGIDLERFYTAYRRFALLLRDARFQARLKLAEGEMMVFDNQRTLHGRTVFSSARFPRHLQGCYLTRDSVYSRLALLRRDLAARSAS